MKKFLMVVFIFGFLNAHEDVEILYNAAVEKYIKNDYDKAIEYMEKVFSTTKQQKHKNFLIKILKEAATDSYMKQNYKKAFEYTSKALKHTKDDPEINKLHGILLDLLNKQQKTQPKQEEHIAKPLQQKETKPHSQITSTKLPTQPSQVSLQPKETTKEATSKESLYKILFFVSLSTIILISLGWGVTQIKLHYKIKKQLQIKIFELEKENSKLKFELIDTKKELEKAKEREEIYKKYLDEYKKETEEKLKLIKEIKLSQKESDKTQLSSFLPIKSKTESILEQKKDDILLTATNPPQGIISSEYQLELYREKLATMLKTLYEVNPEKALFAINQIIKNPSDLIRANIAYALAEIESEITVEMLIQLYQEKSPFVKQEALRQLIKLEKKIKNNESSLSEETKNKILQIVKEEKLKGEWLF